MRKPVSASFYRPSCVSGPHVSVIPVSSPASPLYPGAGRRDPAQHGRRPLHLHREDHGAEHRPQGQIPRQLPGSTQGMASGHPWPLANGLRMLILDCVLHCTRPGDIVFSEQCRGRWKIGSSVNPLVFQKLYMAASTYASIESMEAPRNADT